MEFKDLIYEKIGKKAVITFNRPDRLNALSTNLKHEIIAALNCAGEDKEVRVIIITGAGRAFCAGQELTETKDTNAQDAKSKAWDWIMVEFKNFYNAFRKQDKVLISMINGVAAGSGLQITLLCDYRFLSSTARVGMTEIDVGFPLVTGSGLLWNLVGPMHTKDMALSGRLLDSNEALTIGLVNKVFPADKLREETFAFADFLAEKAPVATAIDKAYYRLLEDEHFHKMFDFAVVAHEQGYASGEPQLYQKKFFEEREAKKRNAEKK